MSNPSFVGSMSESRTRTDLTLTADAKSLKRVDTTVNFDVSDLAFTVASRYSFTAGPGVRVVASRGHTSVEFDVGTGDDGSVSVTHEYDEMNTITPTYSFKTGDYELSWERR